MNPNTAVDMRNAIERDRDEALAELNRKFDTLLQAISETYGIANLKAKATPAGIATPKTRKPRAKKVELTSAEAVAHFPAQADTQVLTPAQQDECERLNATHDTTPPLAGEVTDPAAMLDNRITVLSLLQTGNEALPMADIVAHMAKFGVSENDTKTAVKSLVDDKRITQLGQKRGTKYAFGAPDAETT